ncbi:hypothetical protein ACE6H2_017642 [Prunus campanulata]
MVYVLNCSVFECHAALFCFHFISAGNNDYMFTLSKADSPPYGIDFKASGGHPTGRFTNGRTISDIVGFENANEPCCGGYFPPFICFKSSGTNRSSALCTDQSKYVFWE